MAASVSLGLVAKVGVPAPFPGIFGAVAAVICQLCLQAPVPWRAWHAPPGCVLPAVLQPCGQCGTALGKLLQGGRAAGTWLPATRARRPHAARAQVLLAAPCFHDAVLVSLGAWLAPLACLVARGWAELPSASPWHLGFLFWFWSSSLLQAASLGRGSLVQGQERSAGTSPSHPLCWPDRPLS